MTRREVAVLERIAARQTDREIAGALYVSRRTVSRHVRRILAKLDVRSRGEAVAQAKAAGLL